MFNKRNIVPAVIVIIMFVGGFYSYLSKGNVQITHFEGTKATAVNVVSRNAEKETKEEAIAPVETDASVKEQSVYKDGKVNLNTAGSSDLQIAPGIGPAKAQKIIDYREQYGGFKYLEELMEIKGIGQKTFDKIKDYYYVE